MNDTSHPSTRRQLSAAHAQARLLDAADQLFYREGVRNIGVDSLVALAGVNKMSLYRQFESKDALLLAYLERQELYFWDKFETSIAKHPDAPHLQLPQVFSDWAQRASAPSYRGCPFVNVAAEFADPAHPARQFVLRNKTRLLARITEIVSAAGVSEPQPVAYGIALMLEGCYTASQTYGPGHPLLHAAADCVTAMIERANSHHAG